MTTGIKTPSSYYMELVNAFPPRPITNDAELAATQKQINSLLDKSDLNQDDRDYLKVLGMLVLDYEDKHEPMPVLSGVELLKALMEEADLQAQDLVPIFENESSVLAVLEKRRQLTNTEVEQLAARFQVAATTLKETYGSGKDCH